MKRVRKTRAGGPFRFKAPARAGPARFAGKVTVGNFPTVNCSLLIVNFELLTLNSELSPPAPDPVRPAAHAASARPPVRAFSRTALAAPASSPPLYLPKARRRSFHTAMEHRSS